MVLAAVVMGLGSNIHPHFVKLAEIALSVKQPVSFRQFDSTTKNIVIQSGDGYVHSDVNLVEFARRKVIRLGEGDVILEQADCGAGICGVLARKSAPNQMSFFSTRDGRILGKMPWEARNRRIGNIVQTMTGITDLGGHQLLANVAPIYPKSDPAYIGHLVWNGKRRLSIVGHNDRDDDVKDIVELSPNWKKGKRFHVSDYAMGFDHLLGDPDIGAFAVFEHTNRSVHTTAIFTKELKRIDCKDCVAIATGRDGVVISMVKYDPNRNYNLETGEIRCLNSETGTVIWKSVLESPSGDADHFFSAYWLDGKLILGGKIVDGKKGKQIGVVPKLSSSEKPAGSSREYYYSTTKDFKLVIYQLKLS